MYQKLLRYSFIDFNIINEDKLKTMSYEPGSPECRSLIDAKENILNAMSSLNRIDETSDIRTQLLNIYNKLESMHEARRAQEKNNI